MAAMSAPRSSPGSPGVCPFCALAYAGNPNQCNRCGTLLGEAALDVQRVAAAERRLIRSRKAFSDTLFLVGLLLGGPIITLGDNVVVGGFIVLAGGVASVLRRYTDWSLPGTLVVGALGALAVAAWVIDPARDAVEETLATESARVAYVQALADPEHDLYVQARGAGHVAIWFSVSDAQAAECGEYPPAEVRRHLAELGFLRVVVEERNQSGGLCSFAP